MFLKQFFFALYLISVLRINIIMLIVTRLLHAGCFIFTSSCSFMKSFGFFSFSNTPLRFCSFDLHQKHSISQITLKFASVSVSGFSTL